MDDVTITACAFKLLYWDPYLHYGLVSLLVASVWLSLKAVKLSLSSYTRLTQAKVVRQPKQSDRLLTRIHGKWYDLSNFKHPGGPVALGLAKGRDATALFESHHYFIPRKKLLQILAKYEVPPDEAATLSTLDKRDNGQPYDWSGIDKDGFAIELRELVVDYFTTLANERGIRRRGFGYRWKYR